jgi:hypothetical protein
MIRYRATARLRPSRRRRYPIRASTELASAFWRLIFAWGQSEDHKMILLWIGLPSIVLGSGCLFLWSMHKHQIPTM